ncbi:MAG: TIGR01906 family membrane protein [Dehalococcoidia bacterium]|nr:MAG: TIGR01906 family membrane protein [Dehalococcoidia bacterium]
MRVLGIVAKVLFMVCLPILLVTATIAFEFNSLWLYRNGFEKYNVSQVTGLSEAELEKAATGLISYFNSDEEYISITVVKDGKPFELFNQQEVAHLKDVKGLVRLDYHLLLGTAIYVGAYAGICLFWRRKRYWQRLAWAVVGGSSITLGMMLALGIGSMLLDFGQLFTQFHFLAFTNELWMLDPTKDYLIILFPEGFWYDAAMLFAKITIGVAVTLGGLAGRYLWTRRGLRSKCGQSETKPFSRC